MRLLQALLALFTYLLISCGPLMYVCYLWVKTSYLTLNGVSIFLSIILAILTYLFIRWGAAVVKRTNYPLWLKKLTTEQKSYINTFLNLKKDEAHKLGIYSANEIYQYHYYMIKRTFGSPLAWKQ